jgi:hypothetical protein
LPIKLVDQWKNPSGANLTLALALALPADQAEPMVKTLLNLGATSAQADTSGFTAFHRFVQENAESLLDIVWEMDKTGAQTAINHMAIRQSQDGEVPLHVAIANGNRSLVSKLLANGALAEVDFESWLKAAKQVMPSRLSSFEENTKTFKSFFEQPLIVALKSSNPSIALQLIERGASVDTLPVSTQRILNGHYWSNDPRHSALDMVQSQLKVLRDYEGEKTLRQKPALPEGLDEFLAKFEPGTYKHWLVSKDIQKLRDEFENDSKVYEKELCELSSKPGIQEKKQAIKDAIQVLENVENVMLEKGAKTFKELYPDFKDEGNNNNYYNNMFSGVANNGVGSVAYNYNFVFGNVTDVTELRKTAYIRL